ncbi:ribbon-helix-helix protein, CopG family [Methanobacterium sp. CWC-01]|jgi:predicted transcriptional regulator|nr:ribbon-helix-helix protein, CopG family [Methanobacterium sp. CWC-01]WJI10065.1 ribbon-helix-helix protein, CopG family [Methanobacterium sp. CWC-01]
MAKKSVYIRLESEYIQKIDEMAQKQDRSRSYIIRQLVIKGLGKV